MIWLLSLLYPALSSAIQCISDTGHDVDSWLIIKGPSSTNYFYADPETPFQQSIQSSLNLTTQGALAKTSQQLWNEDVSYFIYNDENPNSNTYPYTYGHLKGYAIIDESDDSVVLVQHSIPKFLEGPSTRSSYGGLLPNAWVNAQHAICLSISLSTLATFSDSLALTRARIYDTHISTTLQTNYPNLTAMLNGQYSTSPLCIQNQFATNGGTRFHTFEKSTQWNRALWDDCIAPFFQTGLIVQSWLQGSPIGANCSGPYPITDVQSVAFSPDFAWEATNDHSKWAISTDQSYACFGDINRVYSQASRGGGAICLTEPNYLAALANATIQTNSC